MALDHDHALCPNHCRCCTRNPPLSPVITIPYHPNAPVLVPDPEDDE